MIFEGIKGKAETLTDHASIVAAATAAWKKVDPRPSEPWHTRCRRASRSASRRTVGARAGKMGAGWLGMQRAGGEKRGNING
jgi:hypothetical protein